MPPVPFAPPEPGPALAWSNAGSPGGGPVQGIGGSSVVLVASTWNHGTFRSFDAGLHWSRIADFPPVTEARVAFDPTDALIGYVYGFGGVARTLDGGQTWTHVLDNFVSYRLAISPSGAILASTRDADGYQHVVRSTDHGETWTDLHLPESRWASMYGLSFGRHDDEVVAMSISDKWVTHDGGATWSHTRGMHLDLKRAPDGTLWLAGFSIQKSLDGGDTWLDVAAPDHGWPLGMGEDGALLVASGDGFFRTRDGGASWEDLGHAEFAFGATSILVDPADPDALFVSDEFLGVTRIGPAPAGGHRAEGRTTGLPPVPLLALGGSADGDVLLAGSTLGLYASRDGGDSWRHTGQGAGMIGITSVAASGDGSVILAGGQNRVFQPFVLTSRDGGETYDIVLLDIGGDGYLAGLAFAGASTTVAYAAATMDLAWSSILETRDGGLHWTPILRVPAKMRDVAWDDASGTLVAATEIGVLRYEGNGAWTPLGATFNTWTVAAEAGDVWSNGPEVSLWKLQGAQQAPWAQTGDYLVDLSAEPGGAAVWAVNDDGRLLRCAPEAGVGACADVSPEGHTIATLVTPDGHRAFAATRDHGIYAVDL